MHKQEYPYQNLSLTNIKGERWKDIPGFEGEFQVSSFGRIKSLSRWRVNGNTGYYIEDSIRRQGLRLSNNKVLKDATYCLSVSLKKDGVSISRPVSHYVYNAFVAPIDLSTDIIISYKDFDGRNVHYKNLLLSSRSEVMKRSYRLQRSKVLEESKVPIVQYTLNGKKVATYASIAEAVRQCGFESKGIYTCVQGHIHQHKGFVWRRKDAKMQKAAGTATKEIFNDYLWEKLGRPKTSRTHPMPVLNLSDKPMRWERWKRMEGLEDSYLVSDFGRFKGLPRLKKGKLNMWTKGGIKKTTPDGKPHKATTCLTLQLSKDGKKFQLAAAKLVYHHFVEKINLSDKAIHIGYKNGKCYDLHYKNLYRL